MSCCDKRKIRKIVGKIKNIIVGNVRAFGGVNYTFADDRERECWKCKESYWILKSVWCKICKCYIPAKARVKEEKCPLNKWDRKE